MIARTGSAEVIRRDVYERLGRFVQAFAAPARLKIIQLLAQAPRNVDSLAKQCGETVANTSQHLQRLLSAGVIRARRDGLARVYSLRSPAVAALWEDLQDAAHEFQPELDIAAAKLTDANLRAPVPASKVMRELAAGRAVLIDVRPPEEAVATPVSGARAIPLSKLDAAIPSFPARQKIFVFCRGRYCHLASEAVRRLRRAGLDAHRLQESPFKLKRIQET